VGTITIGTANAAAGPTAGPPPTNTKIGVSIAAVSGFGTASIQAVFGPGIGSGFPDDVGAAAIPRYVANVGSTAPTRNIIGAITFFTITPVRTVLLYTFATNLFGFQTGIEVANTGNDSTAFAPPTVGQTGTITFFFFPSTAASLSVSSTALIGTPFVRGLNSAGQLAPGAVFAASLNTLLTAAGHPELINPGASSGVGFDGYVIAVCQFNLGHGFGVVFNPSLALSSYNALVLGAGSRVGGVPEALDQ
jgi:hypothetical protein